MDDRVDAQPAKRQLAAEIGNALNALHHAIAERDVLSRELSAYRSRYKQQEDQIRLLRERLHQFERALVATIRGIQRREGNFDCFATATQGFCDQTSCLWRARCLKLSVGRQEPLVKSSKLD
jgi:hypothetical protein